MENEQLKQEQRVLGIGLFIMTGILVFYAFYYRNAQNIEFENTSLEVGTFKSQQLNKEAAFSSDLPGQEFLREVFASEKSQNELVSAYSDSFGKKIKLKYILTKRSDLQIELYNTKGQRVMVWDAGTKNSGEYIMSLGVDHLESGSYYYNFAAGNDLHTGRIDLNR
ncbi:MAG: T9SS type A sorting domain-containing protein [Bacteroidia bacterium]|nr:T9SS type A sorting domain-containing protein [Bacteroidia bacterium]